MRALFKKIIVGVFVLITVASTGFAYAQTTAVESKVDASTSRNWSGYIARGEDVTTVSGSWIVPTPESDVSGANSTWIGIGGDTSRDLIQAGTQAIVDDGEIRYSAWIERLPRAARKIPVRVSGGDSISASITETSPDRWHISLRNNTNGESFETDVAYDSSKSSAEWIEEVPTVTGFGSRLSSFGTSRFTATAATINGASVTAASAGARAVRLVGRAGVLAEPSALQADGTFSVSRTSLPNITRSRDNARREDSRAHRYRVHFFRN
jgi:hypothetical protein